MKLLDRIADWLQDVLGARAQLRLGVALVLLSLPLYVYLPFSGEPPLIYLMSALALTLSGISIVVAAEVLDRGDP